MKSNACQEIFPDVFKITLPLFGSKPGPVNTYLFVGDRITLLDTGILQTADKLEEGLAEIGLSFSDVDQLLFTHGHIDHYGAANQIIKKSGGNILIAAHEEDLRSIETGEYATQNTMDRFDRLMAIPAKHLEQIKSIRDSIKQLAEKCRVNFILNDGDQIQLGNYKGRVVSTPGHSKGSISFYIESENIIFAGDHIIGHVTPNAFVMFDDNHELPVRLSQKEYFNSISKVEKLAPSTVYPAHGELISDLNGIIKIYRDCFSERQNGIISILKSGDHSVYKIARKLFTEIRGRMLSFEIDLAISEVYTHLQVLEEKGVVEFEIGDTLKVRLVDM